MGFGQSTKNFWNSLSPEGKVGLLVGAGIPALYAGSGLIRSAANTYDSQRKKHIQQQRVDLKVKELKLLVGLKKLSSADDVIHPDPGTLYEHGIRDGFYATFEKLSAKPPLGTGGRFANLVNKLKNKKGVYNAKGLAAYIGQKAHGKKQMARWGAKERAKGTGGPAYYY